MSKEFIPKTRLQMYKEAKFGDITNIPDKYFIEETETLIDNKELTFNQVSTNYMADLCDSSIALRQNDVVKIDNVVVPLFNSHAAYQTGDLYWRQNYDHSQTPKYEGASVISVGVSPSGTKHVSVYRTTQKFTLPPRTNIEKYYAYKAGLYEGELPDPKTVDEYYVALECGWESTYDSEESVQDPGK